jgi:hypothetical protein
LAPPIALTGFLGSLLLGSLTHPLFFIPAAIYLFFVAVAAISIAANLLQYIILLTVIPTMHFAWGAGFLTSPKSLVPKE